MFVFVGFGVLPVWALRETKEEKEFRKWHNPMVMNSENFW